MTIIQRTPNIGIGIKLQKLQTKAGAQPKKTRTLKPFWIMDSNAKLTEPTKDANLTYRAFGINCPDERSYNNLDKAVAYCVGDAIHGDRVYWYVDTWYQAPEHPASDGSIQKRTQLLGTRSKATFKGTHNIPSDGLTPINKRFYYESSYFGCSQGNGVYSYENGEVPWQCFDRMLSVSLYRYAYGSRGQFEITATAFVTNAVTGEEDVELGTITLMWV